MDDLSEAMPTRGELALVVHQHEIRVAIASIHGMNAERAKETFEAAVDIGTLTELLVEKGVIGVRELIARRELVRKQVNAERGKTWVGPQLQASAEQVEAPVAVDCATRHPHCKAGCCTLYNVFLTAEEVRSGQLLWELGEPYRLLRGPEGHCRYLDRETLGCSVWETRPRICRQYSCEKDTNVWVDFDRMIVSEKIMRIGTRARTIDPTPTGELDDASP